MKKFILFVAIAFTASLTFTACGGDHEHNADGTHPSSTEESAATTEAPADSESGPEFTSAYICPMHCPGSGSATAGKCPECDMDYVVNEKMNHSHEGHDHEGHEH